MNVRENEILFIYNSSKITDKRALAYAHSLSHVTVKEIDLTKEVLTEKQLVEVAQSLDCKIVDLLNNQQENYNDEVDDKHFSEEDLLKLMSKNADYMQTPVAISGEVGQQLLSEFDLIRKGLAVQGVKIGNFSKERNIA